MAFLHGLPVTDPAAFTDLDQDAMQAAHARLYVASSVPTIRAVVEDAAAETAPRDPSSSSAPSSSSSSASAGGGEWRTSGGVAGGSRPPAASENPVERASFLVRRFYALAAKRTELQYAGQPAQGKRPGIHSALEESAIAENQQRKRFRMAEPASMPTS